MNKAELIAENKRMLANASELKDAAAYLQTIATRLENEAKSRLEDLGSSEGRRRKAPVELSPEFKIKLLNRARRGAS